MTTTSKRALLFAMSALATIVAGAGSASAAGVSVQPRQAGASVSFFELDAPPGATLSGNALLITNPGPRPVQVRLSAVDAQTAENLGFAYEVAGDSSHGATQWTRISPKVTVPAGGEVHVPLTIEVPRDAAAGDYLSGISAEQLGQEATDEPQEGLQVASTKRYAIGLMLKVPGPREAKVELTGAEVTREPAGVTFHVDAENTGNVLLRDVTGHVEVTRDGERVADAKLGPGTFVADTSFSYPLLAAGEEPKEGTEYRVQAVLDYRGGQATLDQTVVFGAQAAQAQEDFGGPAADQGVAAWQVLALVALLLATGAGAFALRRRYTKWEPLSPADAVVRLESELDAARVSGRPVSTVRVSPGPRGEELMWPLLAEVLPRVRPEHAVCSLGHGEIMVIAPGVDRGEAERLAGTLRASLSASRYLANRAPVQIGTMTSRGQETAASMIAGGR